MTYVPDGAYFGGGSEDEDDTYCGFDFGDTPSPSKKIGFPKPSTTLQQDQIEENVVNDSKFATADFTLANGVDDTAPNSVHVSKKGGGFGLPPKLTNQRSAGGMAAEGRKRGRRRMRSRDGRESYDQGKKARSLEVGEDLRAAVVRGKEEEAKRILDNGFDPNTALKSGWTALMYACDHGDERIVELLLNRGANPNTQKDHFTALMAVCCSKSDKEEKLVKSARVLVNKGARVNAHDRHHMSPLLYACQHGHCGLAQLLVDTNADINKQDTRGWTPLHYAASKGNKRLIQILLGSNANVTIMCNLGETAASIAYAYDHTTVADMLENAVSSKGALPSSSTSLPPHPLLDNTASGGATLETKASHTPPPSHPQSGGECVRYGDLDLFLLGLQLGDLLPLFQSHRVKFSDLLSMTDRDLEQMGVSQVGVRKRIMDGVLEIHKKQWDMPRNNLPYNRAISSSEAAVILSHLSLHASYIQGTASFLLTHVKSSPSMLDPNMEPSEAEKLTNEISGAVTAVSSLHTEVQTLQNHIHKALGTQQQLAQSKRPSRIPPKLLKAVTVTGTVVVLACTVYFTGRALVHHFNAR